MLFTGDFSPYCRRGALLAGVSLSALAVAAPARAAAPRVFSQAWFAARVDASTAGAAAAGSAASQLAQVSTAQRNLATLATRLQAMETAQQAAAQAAVSAASKVPNGLAIGGLQLLPGVTAGAPAWTGANLPTQAQKGGRDEVTVQQTAPQAMLTWQTFNVGSKTDLHFDQSGGGANAAGWVVLNRVEDPAAQPSQILGSITAPGKVYVINANGILFGAGSQVNLGALIASTADISNAQFATGIYGVQGQASLGQNPADFVPSFTGATPTSRVTVAAGAQITTAAPASVTASGGYVMLLGGEVENDGQITTPQGQTVLAAGQDFILRPGYSTTGNQTATVLGSQIETTGASGKATNTGLITANLGDITQAGHDVTQAGIELSTTSVTTRGTIHFLSDTADASGTIAFAPGSVTSIAPDGSATTALDSQRQRLITQSAANNALRKQVASSSNPLLGDVSVLADRLDQSRIEVTTGGFVQFDNGSLAIAQGGQIAVQAGLRTWVGDGAALDVSGSTGAVLPMSSNVLTVNIQGNELRDAPVNRDTGLISSNNVSLDIGSLVQVAAGTDGDPNARAYTQGGLLEVGGYLATIGHTIDEWDAVGGTITLAGRSVVTQPLANLDIAGGAVTVQAGDLPQSYLIGPGGQLYDANTAPANIRYTGVYDGFSVSYRRFGGTDTYANSVATPAQVFRSGYSYGRDAGSVVISAPTAVLEASIDAGVTDGANQTAARPAGVTDGYTLSQSTIAQPGTLAITGLNAGGTALLDTPVTISGDYVPLADTITPGGFLPTGSVDTVGLSAAQLSASGLGGFSAVAGDSAISVTGPLSLAQGGTLSLAAASVSIAGNLTARGGRITIGTVTTVNGQSQALLPPRQPLAGGGVTIAQGATIDLRGIYTNAILTPNALAGEGLVNGGTLTIDSLRGLQIGAGSLIDASSGGALLAGNVERGGTGGDVTLIGDDPNPALGVAAGTAAVVIGASFRDSGIDGGGTLALTAPDFVIGAPSGALAANTVLLDPATFQTGFSDYVINGFNGLSVAPETVVTVAEPVYTFYAAPGQPANAPSGQDPSSVFALLLPPTYAENQANGRLTQRKGASVAFIANNNPGQGDYGGGPLTIGAGAAINVDPGQSVRLEAYGQITDDGSITARGGSVSIVNQQRNLISSTHPLTAPLALSIWIGGDASIDVAGLATTAQDQFGRSFGVVTAGGSITLGSDGGVDGASLISTDAQIVLRPGAVLDASGASASIDLLAGTTPQLSAQQIGPVSSDLIVDATSGGAITVSSYAGINLDGTLRAASGGAGAAGGALSIALEAPVYSGQNGTPPTVPDALRIPRILTISDSQTSVLPDAGLSPGEALPTAAYGQASISQQQISAGGFNSLSLYARDVLSFAGDVSLHLPGAVTLSEGIIADTSRDAAVTIAAPSVTISGETAPQVANGPQVVVSINNANWKSFQHSTQSSFTIDASLIDLVNNARFGITETYALAKPGQGPAPTRTLSEAGFGQITLASSGDIRFGTGSLTTPGDLTLAAADIYPTTGATAVVYAGYNQYTHLANIFRPDGTITVIGNGNAAAVPFSVGGSLSLYAGAIVQGGVIRAPEGKITLGGVGAGPSGLAVPPDPFYTYSVNLLPGSVTSVSLDGATIPYGGTVDGVTYSYNGVAIPSGGSFNSAITLAGQTQMIDAGALLDMSGGGTLAGAGFITGRGGSTNVLTSPLLVFDAANGSFAAPSLAQQPIYAIVPGYVSGYAPTSPVEASGSGGSVPALGSQITIGAGVPGVAPGTYTLLPSYYALLPGAARVQINTGSYDRVPGVTALGAGSYALNATTSVANTAIASAMPVGVVVTTGAGVLLNSEFNQESYSQFELSQAANFGTPRVALPEDGKTLSLIYPAQSALVSALNDAGTAWFSGVDGYYSGQVNVGGVAASALKLEITADGAAPVRGFTTIAASALDALDAPRLVIGGSLAANSANPSELDFKGTAGKVIIKSGAVLRAPEIFLTTAAIASGGLASSGAITVQNGAVLDTVGAGAAPYDTPSSGFYYNANGYSVIALSNGALTFTPDISSTPFYGPITVVNGASLLTEGTLTFATTAPLSLGEHATFGARALTLDVNTINIASQSALKKENTGALVLPPGFTLTQPVLSRLLDGDPALGTPALQTLVLTASQSVNFAGSVSLDTLNPQTGQSTLKNLVLNTPAIYGFGNSTDVATITTGTLYWNGVQAQIPIGFNKTVTGSALPGGVVANGPGTGHGTLDIVAQSIVLGAGPDTQPDSQITLDRLIEGFGTVNLTASDSISANDRGTLSVYAREGAVYGAPGVGGTLNVVTPLLTGGAGSIDAITVGGALSIAAPGSPSASADGALGAEIDLTATSITDASTILLNAGRLSMTATSGDITLAAGARVDLSGESVPLLDQTAYADGGSVTLDADKGSIIADSASSIDVSAVNASAGGVTLTALKGAVGFAGTIAGSADSGQTGSTFDLRSGTLDNFDALNTMLDAGGVFGSRAFEIAQGDIVIDQTVRAHQVNITADTGAITLAGTIDASGAAPGAISLAAGANLTIANGAVLDAHGTVAQTDSTGAPIESENRASVALTTSDGTLFLGDATIDVSSPVATPLGTVSLTAPRSVVNGNETGEVAISAAGPITIIGAQTIALYGSLVFRATDAAGTIVQHANGIDGEVTIDQLSASDTSFIDLAEGSTTLAADTAGLSAYGAAYHLRAADIIESSKASGGDLTVSGDLDLSGLRTGPAAGSAPGAGEPGQLTLRAGNNLFVNGSISDGFAAPPDSTAPTPDDNGWVLYRNEPLGQAVTLPTDLAAPVVLAKGSTFYTGNAVALDYPIPISAATLNANVVIPTAVVTAANATIPAGGVVATATILGKKAKDGSFPVIALRGAFIPGGTVIRKGSTLEAGSVLPFEVSINATTWPAGASLSLFATGAVELSGTLTLAGGDTIPPGSSLKFSGNVASIDLRPTGADGVQGLIYATASLLPPGSPSWSINLVGGANLASANVLAVQPASVLARSAAASGSDPAGSVVLADTHYTLTSAKNPTASFSVIRTGTGDLSIVASGNFDETSLFGVYTAGTQTSLGAASDAAFNPGRAPSADGTVLGNTYTATNYNAVVASQQASYPDHGGDVLVAAQGSVTGDLLSASGVTSNGVVLGGSSDNVGNWLWRQGGAAIGASTSWWINFGSYVIPLNADASYIVGSTVPVLTGFTGIGTLGGGNLTVQAGGDAGEIGSNDSTPNLPVSQGLVLAVGDTGRVQQGVAVQTGGGALSLDVGGTLNPALQLVTAAGELEGGTLTDLRGNIDVQAGQVGRIDPIYNRTNPTDPRAQDPFTTQAADFLNGIIVVPGDGVVTIDAMRDVVLNGAGDPTREPEQALAATDPANLPTTQAGYGDYAGFSLWTPSTAINLFSAGGNLTPTTAAADSVLASSVANDLPTDYRFLYPGTLDAVAASGSFYYGVNYSLSGGQIAGEGSTSLELAPSPIGNLTFLAANSIYAHGYAVDISGASNAAGALPTPQNPTYETVGQLTIAKSAVTVIGNSNYLQTAGNVPNPNALFAFEADTPTTDLHQGDPAPARIYAASGDLVDVQFGEILNFVLGANEPVGTWYLAAKPGELMAERDIVSNGTMPAVYPSGYASSVFTNTPNQRDSGASSSLSTGSVLLNLTPTDISVVSAGRDILGSYFYVAGPGLLEVDAGRNINETGDSSGKSLLAFGVLKSLGPVIGVSSADRSGGAGISVIDGTGSIGPDTSAFADLYFNAANQANLAIPLADPANAGKVQQTYQNQLLAWLQSEYGYTGDAAGALAYYFTLPVTAQNVFARSVFFDELLASGRQEGDPASLFYKSHTRGRTAIATLFPATSPSGQAIGYDGSITMDSGTIGAITDASGTPAIFDAGISTLYGGDIQILSPGGGDTFGTTGGPIPGASSGVVTQGSGSINIYALDSVLLGQSRIFTTFGGNIQIWSAQGDINAGRGSKTTLVVPPPLIAYDPYGGITLAPTVPTSGAGIATLAPIAGIVPGDVDLVAPLGTVDAGEAGIRVSGNLNIAALTVVNAANIQVQGRTSGNTATVSVNVQAATAAAASAGSQVAAATSTAPRQAAQAVQEPSIITVEIVAGGSGESSDDGSDERRRRPAI
jgi:filamentous hemagglutinin family protein